MTRRHFISIALACPLLACSRGAVETGPAPIPRQSAASADSTLAGPVIPAGADAGAKDAAVLAARQPPEGMVLVPGGRFEMGMPPELTGGNPRVPTDVAPFFLDRLEVTTEAYLACVQAGRCEPTAKKPGCNATARKPRLKHPVNCVTKVQAERYCTQQGKRLPSEAEWEFAARGKDGRIYPWGNELPNQQLCWERRQRGEATTCPVGAFPEGASPFGALDLAGNVWEWTSTPETEGVVRPPEGQGAYRIRGGSFKVDEMSGPDDYEVRSDQPSRYPYDGSSTEIGVRCAKGL